MAEQYGQTHLVQGSSPEPIVGRLRREYPDDMGKHLSTEDLCGAGCAATWNPAHRAVGRRRQARKARRPRSRGTDRRGQHLNMTLIADP
ncbi:MAG: hypothetical protein ABIU05_26055 [Nitrospirales bacterium]